MKLRLLLLLPLLALSACSSSSPFTPASNPAAGKIPVQVIASADATGNTTGAGGTDYTGGVKVVFGKGVPLSAREELLRRLKIGPQP